MNDKRCDTEAMVGSREFACGSLYIRTNGSPMPKGALIVGPPHKFDHTSLVLSGSFRIKTDKMEGIFKAFSWVLIEAGMQHEIECLEDGSTFWCVYSHRNAQGDIVQESTGWEAYQ